MTDLHLRLNVSGAADRSAIRRSHLPSKALFIATPPFRFVPLRGTLFTVPDMFSHSGSWYPTLRSSHEILCWTCDSHSRVGAARGVWGRTGASTDTERRRRGKYQRCADHGLGVCG